MEVVYTLTKEDVLGFVRFHTRRKGSRRWIVLVSNLLCGVVWVLQLCMFVGYVVEWNSLFRLGPPGWSLFVRLHQHTLIGFLLLSLYLVYMAWGQKVLRHRLIPDASLLGLAKHMRIGPNGVEVITNLERLHRPWSDIRDIASDKDRLYLYTTPTTALTVPKRSFISLEDAQAFEAEARAYRSNPYLNGSIIPGTTDTAVWPPPPQLTYVDAVTQEGEPDDVPGSLQIQYVTRKADLWRSQMYFYSRRPSALLSIFIPYAFAVGIWTLGRLPLPLALLCTISGAVAAALLTLAWTTQKALSQRFARFADGRPCRTVLRPDMLCDVTPEGRTIYRWPEVQSVRSRFGDIYVLSKANRGAVIPRTAFADRRTAQEFMGAIERFRREGQAATGQVVQTSSII